MSVYSCTYNNFTLSTDSELLQLDVIHGYLKQAYWSPNIARDVIEKSIQHSLCFGIYTNDQQQVGFARVVTDYAKFAYLADVFVLPEHQGKGLGKWLLASILAHPDLASVMRWMLQTADAHGLYQQYGFVPLANPSYWLELS